MTQPTALGSLMLAFEGTTLPEDALARLRSAPSAGVTLFRSLNVETPGQVRELAASIQRAAGGSDARRGPALVAADQEGGQLLALGAGATPFAGAMALGAAGDPALAERVARAVGLECAAMGVNVVYGPVCDLATNPANPAIGIRSFGDDPTAVGALVAATVRGLQSSGVAAALKHFPGLGDVAADSHHALPVLEADVARLEGRELAPFRAGIGAGARVVMSAHLAVPGLTGDAALPATLSRAVMTGLLRDRLGFDRVSITDALDMGALGDGSGQGAAAAAALDAGIDLLLTAADPVARARIERGIAGAVADARSTDRVAALRAWLAGFEQPELGVVGCDDHRALARELATRSLTLVRDEDGLLPLRVRSGARLAAIQPRPTDQTPADTSASVAPGLASALRGRFERVDQFVVDHAPSRAAIAAAREAVRDHDAIVLGTTAAFIEPAQAALAEAILDLGRPTVTVSLRTPFDLAAYPAAGCHVAAYGILGPTLVGLAAALAGDAPFTGRLPAAIPGLYPTGHGLTALPA
ncbi:MAG TPA: glycoside hydrolase family 3 N-terminal domain-containing protein [Candidatus Limnocylindrales bacterium]|nr:glycoside hydrolase family 3 N-terminal domain-containing protein [Candidatus Limnocylindrales bacterium]